MAVKTLICCALECAQKEYGKCCVDLAHTRDEMGAIGKRNNTEYISCKEREKRLLDKLMLISDTIDELYAAIEEIK